MTSWILLVVAILFEVAGTTSMKLSAGFTKAAPSVLIFVFYALAFGALTLTLKKAGDGAGSFSSSALRIGRKENKRNESSWPVQRTKWFLIRKVREVRKP